MLTSAMMLENIWPSTSALARSVHGASFLRVANASRASEMVSWKVYNKSLKLNGRQPRKYTAGGVGHVLMSVSVARTYSKTASASDDRRRLGDFVGSSSSRP